MPYPPQGIGGAGVSKLSELIIDADKNWNNKRIMNLGAPTADSDAARFDSIPMPFGDGRDGDVTITSNTTLSRDMYYRNLTVNAGASLDTNNYSIFVSNKLTVAGKIHADGRGGAGGGGGCVECIGGYNILAENGSPGTSQNITLYLGTALAYTLYTGGGGGGGGSTCDSYALYSYGGSGGRGGGIVKIFASYIVIQSGGVISANGLNGGDAIGYGNSGGGGGGGGGTVFILYRYMVNNGSITANGGAGGSGIYCCSSGYFPVQPKAGGAGGNGAAGGSAGATGNPPTAGGNGASSASGGGGGGGGGGGHTGNGSGASGGAGGNGAVILRRIG